MGSTPPPFPPPFIPPSPKRGLETKELVGVILAALALLGIAAWLEVLGSILAFAALIGVIIWMIFHVVESSIDKTTGKINYWKLAKHEVTMYTGVLLVADLTIFLGIDALWAWVIRKGMMYFWLMNALAILTIFLKTKKNKEKGGAAGAKKKVTRDKGASTVGNCVIALMVLLTAGNFGVFGSKSSTPRGKVIQEAKEKVAEVVDSDSPLFVIGKCVTGLQHYEAGQEKDKKVRRAGNRIGMFAIPESLEGEASAQKFDIYTPAGNVGYAQWKFNQEGPLQWMEWVDCWSRNRSLRSFTLKVEAPTDKYSTTIIFDGNYHLDVSADGAYSFKHFLMDANPWEGSYVPNEKVHKWPKTPIYSMSWKSDAKSPLTITVRARRERR